MQRLCGRGIEHTPTAHPAKRRLIWKMGIASGAGLAVKAPAMAVESKPLFHPEVMRQQVRSFPLPELVAAWQPKLQHWASLISSGRADEFKETALLPDYLTDIFCGLLGYTGPAGPADTFTFSRERHVEVEGEFADAVLGRFQKDKEQFMVVLEGKGTRNPLDRPFAGRRMCGCSNRAACSATSSPTNG